MPLFKSFTVPAVITILLICSVVLSSYKRSFAPPPSNDNCSNSTVIDISGGGYDYGNYSSTVSDMSSATGQAGEFFQFAPNHTKSVWFKFSLQTRRSAKIEILAAAGSFLTNPTDAGVTVYHSAACLPGSGNKLGAFISSGDLSNPCLEPGTYFIQVTGVSSLTASILVNLTISCPDHPVDSRFDCPAGAYVFNSGMPLTSNSPSDIHNIGCHSIEDMSENTCLPIANKTLYSQSSWYVFTTGSAVDFIDFYFPSNSEDDIIGYRLLEGNVIVTPPSSLSETSCGTSKARFTTQYIEFPCELNVNTTYSLALIFHRDYAFSNMRLTGRQRAATSTGWPRPALPPLTTSNQLGILPAASAPGITTSWTDQFDCSAFILDNVCPPANPASGKVVIGGGANARTFDLATWSTFSLSGDSHVEFRYTTYNPSASYHTRIFSRTINNCPSPNPAPGTDLYFEFGGSNTIIKCMPAGDYSMQVLASSSVALPPLTYHQDAWSYGALGTQFTLGITVSSQPVNGIFRLEASGNFDAINNLNPLQNNVTYNTTPAVFVCANTVLPMTGTCTDLDKAIYREVNIGDADGDGIPDEGLLTMKWLRTDTAARPPIFYSFYKGDANQLATGASTHTYGQLIPGMENYAGFCVERDDYDWITPGGIENFCACVTPGVYTLTSLGDVDNIGKGDAPEFRFNTYKTIHDSRANAELVFLGPTPGVYSSGPDVFSCTDNLGTNPPCGTRAKLVFREFFLAEPSVVSITEIGNNTTPMIVYSGRASDLASDLTPISNCTYSFIFIDLCTPLDAGWYTVISYGSGPNYTTNRVVYPTGDPGDVGKTTRLRIALVPPVIPNFNLPSKAHIAGITDWATPPAAFPNAVTRRIYPFPSDTFCEPDTPFIPEGLLPCAPGYNRVSMYVFEITKPSFIQIRNIDQTFYTQVFPFDVNATPGSLLTIPPVYPCYSIGREFRQLCDLPPGKYTIAIFANDNHKGTAIFPSIYVDEAGLSRFDHVWNAYDFDVIPPVNAYVNGRTSDTHPFLPGQAPSRDVFYCTTGSVAGDPLHTRCETQINPHIYSQPFGVPKPLFLQGNPALPNSPWRNIWYTFMLSGSGICSLRTEILNGADYPLIAVYSSPVDANISWSDLQTMLANPGNPVVPGLRLIKERVNTFCDAELGDLIFTKSGCQIDSVRYYVVVSFDAHNRNAPPNLPNQAVSLSIKYDPRPTFPAPYDELTTANVINGLMETAPPYLPVWLSPGSTFTSTDFSLLCYTRNVTDPPGCNNSGSKKSAWFKFDVTSSGHFYTALQEVGVPNGWFVNAQDISVWRETSPGAPLTQQILLDSSNTAGHEWLEGCIETGTYYLLVRHCNYIDTIQPYRVVLELHDSPGDFCYNAIPLSITGTSPVTSSAIVDCHSIGTDIGEFLPIGNTCFSIPGRKTTWFRAVVNAGPMVDLNFQLEENFEVNHIGLNEVAYRILAGTCGAMTPIACSANGTNIITLNCLGPGDYYVQVSMPEKTGPEAGNLELEGTISLTVTATASNPLTCTDPSDPQQVNADFIYTSDCQSITLINLSTAGTDISYLWEFPDGTSTEANPTWTPPGGATSYTVTLTVTNNATNISSTVTLEVMISTPFASYIHLSDTVICNEAGDITLDATLPGATYLWDNASTNSTRITSVPGTFWVRIRKDGCELLDTAIVKSIVAKRAINSKICPESSIVVGGQIFDINNPNGTVTIPDAHPEGCDSILTVNLSFYPAATIEYSKTICAGETFSFGGQTLAQSGTYTQTLSSSDGCDSVETLLLTVISKQLFDHVVSGCIGAPLQLGPNLSGETYEWSNDASTETILVNAPGTYTVSVSDMSNCIVSEETFTVSFGILSSPTVEFPDPVCPGADVVLSAAGSSGEYQWFDAASGGNMLGSGSTLVVGNVQANSTVYVQAFLVGFDTCISLREAIPILVTEEVAKAVLDTTICPGTTVAMPWGGNVSPVANSSYVFVWQSVVTGCDSLELTFNVNIFDGLSLSLPSLITLQLGDSVLFIPQFNFHPASLAWTPANSLSCSDCPQPWASPTQSTDYVLSIWSQDGCLVKALTRIEVQRNIRIFIPNVFSPNGDYINDIFTVFARREVVLVRKLTIFDRWGEAVWEAENFSPDGETGWDGLFHEKPMSSGVYVWVCEVELIDGTKEVLAGDVTLIR